MCAIVVHTPPTAGAETVTDMCHTTATKLQKQHPNACVAFATLLIM